MRRDDTDERRHFRSTDRLFSTNTVWFFESREGDHGPYDTRQEAQAELARYVKKMAALNPPPKSSTPEITGRLSDFKLADLQLVDKDDPSPATS